MSKIITISRKKIDVFLIMLVILMDCNFLYLIRIPSALSYYWGQYVKFLPIMIALAHLLWIKGWTVRNKFLKLYTVLLIISFFTVSFFSCIYYYNQSTLDHFINYGNAFFVLLAFPLLKLFQQEGGYENFLERVNVIAFFSYVFTILQALVFKATGFFFLHIGHNTRNGNVRIALSGLANYFIIYNFCRIFVNKGKKKLFNIIQLFLGLVSLFFIEQTRAFEIAVVLAFGIVILFNNTGEKKRFVTILLTLIILVAAIELGFIDKFMSSFEAGSEGDTAAVRVEGYLYFWNVFLNNPLWGHGFPVGPEYRFVRSGPTGRYIYADTGIVGAIAQYGIFIVPVYILPIFYSGVKLFKNIKQKDVFLLASFVFIVSLTPTLLVLNPERAIIWGIFMALFAYSEKTESELYVDKRLLWFGKV